MPRWAHLALSGGVVVALAAGLLAVGAAAGSPPAPDQPIAIAPADPRAARITQLQADLARTPGRYTAWNELGFAYLEQSRIAADPSSYAKAEGAFARSLVERPADNDGALTGQASLAAARHDFAAALALTDRSLMINDYSPTTYAVRVDALVELGRYEEAQAAAQRLLDLSPGGLDALTRGSYVLELSGDVEGARSLLEQAADAAASPEDEVFARYYLAEIAFSTGDLVAARAAYDAGLSALPDDPQLVGGRARVLAAEGETEAAIADLRAVVERLPAPQHLVAYGELLEAAGQREAAQEQYDVVRATQRLFAASGQDVDTELALFEADHGTPAAAVASAEKAYAKRPRSVVTQDAYAWALHKAGRSAEALPVARDALRLGWRNPAMLARVGTIEAAAGDRPSARRLLTEALALNPAFSPLHAPAAAALLESLR